MLKRTCSLLLVVLICVGCIPAATDPPSPTSTEAPATSWPSDTAFPSVTPETPTLTASATIPTDTATPGWTETLTTPLPTLAHPTASPTGFPQPAAQSAAIQFYKPGPLSTIISPLHFYGYAIPGYNHRGVIELTGEDGTVLASEILQLNTDYKWAFFQWHLAFNVRGAGELGRLTLTTRDEYGRLTAVQSLHLLLLPEGLEIINPPGSLAERCVITDPLPGTHITGGTVEVSGEMQPYNEQPLVVELVARDGSSLGTQLVPIAPGQAGAQIRFSVEIPYIVTGYTPVLLSVHQADERIGGTMYLYSQEISLYP
jgi:hypothetical protein